MCRDRSNNCILACDVDRCDAPTTRLFAAGTRQLLGTRIIETGSGHNAQSVRPAHFGVPGEGAVDVEITLMTKGGRKALLIEDVDAREHAGGHLSVKVKVKVKVKVMARAASSDRIRNAAQ